MQLAAARHRPRVRRIRIFHPERDVALELPVKSLSQLARSDELPLPAGEWRVVHEEVHRDCRLLDGDSLETLRALDVSHGQADLHSLEAGECDDFSSRRFPELDSLESLVTEELRHLRLFDLHVRVERQKRDLLPDRDPAPLDSPDPQSSQVRRIVYG